MIEPMSDMFIRTGLTLYGIVLIYLIVEYLKIIKILKEKNLL